MQQYFDTARWYVDGGRCCFVDGRCFVRAAEEVVVVAGQPCCAAMEEVLSWLVARVVPHGRSKSDGGVVCGFELFGLSCPRWL